MYYKYIKENILAIVIFGSYGTEKKTLESDIDIAEFEETYELFIQN
ncbi:MULTISPECIES: nucleotidyltransferase domain-containing protein [Terrisporobacter]|uniref:Nucleotidyltransferase domain-containing protein n=1 Tax=Terrisporobacter muris TaxID=2963284 RepID=A0A9X2M9G8_9FIRM|nr:nucleotidyltransferase domain-containing protein [Terrisporobacter othiniensis]MCC3670907.1 nucleotidyltransferase domain-containing protein [Terrisporobacter mayombei]MCR1823237.1 nucleotidyltransferase domain-containing protein [Terrisporobacter muris]MDY3373855.1 nucleotidyltransferase domain-containing protein [Terrisporobacter othiniensis]